MTVTYSITQCEEEIRERSEHLAHEQSEWDLLKRWFKKTDTEINHIGRNGEYDEQLASLQDEMWDVKK